MFARFNSRQLEALETAVERDEALTEEFQIDRRWVERICYIDSPYLAWVKARDILAAKCFKPQGRKHPEVPRYTLSALKSIATATNDYFRHPGLRGMGMLGHQTHILHVWVMPTPSIVGHVYSPVPMEEVDGFYAGRTKFTVLNPVWHISPNQITTWATDGFQIPDDRLADERVHLQFWDQA